MNFNDFKKIRRFREIVAILVKYGFDEIVDRLEVPGSDFLKKIHPEHRGMTIYERIRAAFEDLGPTYVKFGQIMSLRPDLLPRELLLELEKLQDDVVAVETAAIIGLLEENLGRTVQEVFSLFVEKPVAAASLSQVHKGVLRSEGREVAIKVQRPNITRSIRSDLDILESFCSFLSEQFEAIRGYDLPKVVQSIRRTLMKELDFQTEMENLKIARSYAKDTDIHIPEVYEEYCSKQVLIMEFVDGLKFRQIKPDGVIDGESIARRGLQAAIKQILEDGFFHADPHPGNLILGEGGRLFLVDWGMVGRLTEKDRFMLIELLKAVVDKDSDALAHGFLRLCKSQGRSLAVTELERGLLDILETYHAKPIRDVNVGQLLMSLVGLIRHHHLVLPPDLVIMVKALVTAEGTARQVYPNLNIVAEVRESVYRLALLRFRPEVLWRSVRNSFTNLWFSQFDLPQRLKNLIEKLEQGDIGFRFELERLEQLGISLEASSNRLTVAIITGSIIMGSSMIITTGIGPYLFGFPALGVIGYLISVVLGLWLVVTILRKKRY